MPLYCKLGITNHYNFQNSTKKKNCNDGNDEILISVLSPNKSVPRALISKINKRTGSGTFIWQSRVYHQLLSLRKHLSPKRLSYHHYVFDNKSNDDR